MTVTDGQIRIELTAACLEACARALKGMRLTFYEAGWRLAEWWRAGMLRTPVRSLALAVRVMQLRSTVDRRARQRWNRKRRRR